MLLDLPGLRVSALDRELRAFGRGKPLNLCYRASMFARANASVWNIRGKRKFLIAAMTELAGDAHLSFEGNLHAMPILDLVGASGDETSILKRNTSWPIQDFVVLSLEADLIKVIVASIGGTVSRRILHIQIEKSGILELGLYDNFDPNCSFFGSRLTPEFFSRLESEGILRQWTRR